MEDRIDYHRIILLDRLDPNSGLLDILFVKRILSRGEVQKIELPTNTTEIKNRLILDCVTEKKIAQQFINALEESQQMHLVNYIKSDGAFRPDFGEDWPLSDREVNILDNNRVSLIDNIDPIELYDRLLAGKVINNKQKEVLSSKSTVTEMNRTLLDMIRQGSLRQFNKTIQCLCDSNQVHIAKILSEETENGWCRFRTQDRQQINNATAIKDYARDESDLTKGTQNHSSIPGEFPDDDVSGPILVKTISTKMAEEQGKAIYGLTILDNELFIASLGSSEIEVYDSINFRFSRRWNVDRLVSPVDMGSCGKNKCIYVMDCKALRGSCDIFRIDPNGKLLNNWSTEDNFGCLSVTFDSNLVIAVFSKNKLIQYSADGVLIAEILLSSILHPVHAIKRTDGHFVVSHGCIGDRLHRICVVDNDGEIKQVFGNAEGSDNALVNVPGHLAVDGTGFLTVADCMNSRMLLLDSKLTFRGEILNKEQGLRLPFRFHLDIKNSRLFLVDNADIWKDGRILVFNLK